jgi:eukaryotic-like serine/threonine-protein kinase
VNELFPAPGEPPTLTLARRVDHICDRFEEDWLAGREPRIEQFLAGAPESARPALVQELLRVELETRCRRGNPPALEEYRPRFPEHLGLISSLLSRLISPRKAAPKTGGRTQAEGESAPHPAGPLPLIPGYEITGVLGEGGMGIVYQARHIALNRPVALKMIRAGAYAGERERARFQAEAEVVARLRHPNIVQVYEVGAHDGRPFLALEFVEGGSLASRLKSTPQPPRQAAQLVETLARAVDYAHQQGVVHRDLKPANILLMFSREPAASAPRAGAGSPDPAPALPRARGETRPQSSEVKFRPEEDALIAHLSAGEGGTQPGRVPPVLVLVAQEEVGMRVGRGLPAEAHL